MVQRMRSDGIKNRERNEIERWKNKHFGYVMKVMKDERIEKESIIRS